MIEDYDPITTYYKILCEYFKRSSVSPFNIDHVLYINYKNAIDFINYIHKLDPALVRYSHMHKTASYGGGTLSFREDLCDYHAQVDDLKIYIRECPVRVAPVVEPMVHCPQRSFIFTLADGLKYSCLAHKSGR